MLIIFFNLCSTFSFLCLFCIYFLIDCYEEFECHNNYFVEYSCFSSVLLNNVAWKPGRLLDMWTMRHIMLFTITSVSDSTDYKPDTEKQLVLNACQGKWSNKSEWLQH